MSDIFDDGDDGVAPDPHLIHGSGPQVLGEIYRRRRAGASLGDIRRDTAVDETVSDAHLEAATEGGRWVTEYQEAGRVQAQRRIFRGIDLPKKRGESQESGGHDGA